MMTLDDQIRRMHWSAEHELQRLNAIIEQSGALPGEVRIVWNFVRGRGAWPRIA